MKIHFFFIKSIFYYLVCLWKIRRARNLSVDDLIYTTKENIQILVYPGKKPQSPYDFIVKFKELDKVGEFSVEFILVVTELIGIQEKTNYPEGSLTESLYKDFGIKDRFSVIQKATWRNR